MNTNNDLFTNLMKIGVKKNDAQILQTTYGNCETSEFIEGSELIAEIMVKKDRTSFQNGKNPKTEPWQTIYSDMENEVIVNSEAVDTAFSKSLGAYSSDKDLQLAITNAISSQMGIIQQKQQSQNNRKGFKTKDYKKELHGLGYSVSMREIDNRIFVNGKPIEDHIENTIINAMTDKGFAVDQTKRVISEVAGENKYHPIEQYLDSLTYDGGDYIAQLASYFNDSYGMFSVWLRKWLIGSCAKVYESEQNPMLILDGKQGIGKSEFVRWLASPIPEYFIESAINTNDKDCAIRLINSWIWEVSELGTTTRKSDYEALKAFLTTRKVTVRKPYGKHDIDRPAMASFIGTINNSSGIFSDPTGSRRFRTSKITNIVWDYKTDLDINDIWAEAMAAYRGGENWKLTPDELQKSNAINTEYDAVTPVEDMIRKYFELDISKQDWFLPSVDIFAVLTDTTKGNIKGSSIKIYMDIKNTMTKLGHEKTVSEDNNGNRVNGYKGIRLQSSPFSSASMQP